MDPDCIRNVDGANSDSVADIADYSAVRVLVLLDDEREILPYLVVHNLGVTSPGLLVFGWCAAGPTQPTSRCPLRMSSLMTTPAMTTPPPPSGGGVVLTWFPHSRHWRLHVVGTVPQCY